MQTITWTKHLITVAQFRSKPIHVNEAKVNNDGVTKRVLLLEQEGSESIEVDTECLDLLIRSLQPLQRTYPPSKSERLLTTL
jgi:hypothetical protein